MSLGKTPARAFAWISSYMVNGSLARLAASSLQRDLPPATARSCASSCIPSGMLGPLPGAFGPDSDHRPCRCGTAGKNRKSPHGSGDVGSHGKALKERFLGFGQAVVLTGLRHRRPPFSTE